MGLDVSVRPGWTPVWACWPSPEPPDTFSSSLLLRQAALGFRFRSAGSERQTEIYLTKIERALDLSISYESHQIMSTKSDMKIQHCREWMKHQETLSWYNVWLPHHQQSGMSSASIWPLLTWTAFQHFSTAAVILWLRTSIWQLPIIQGATLFTAVHSLINSKLSGCNSRINVPP